MPGASLAWCPECWRLRPRPRTCSRTCSSTPTAKWAASAARRAARPGPGSARTRPAHGENAMTCDDCTELIDDYEDGRLAPAAAADVRLHLETCAACGSAMADIAGIRAAARQLGPVEPPERVWTR